MTILSVIQRVCPVVGVAVPLTSVFSNIANNRTMQEMVALADEMAQRIAYDHREWTAFYQTWAIVGDGVTSTWFLPADYKRMLLKSNVWSSLNTITPLRFIGSADDWTQRRARNINDAPGEWIIGRGRFAVWPPPAVGETISLIYLDKNCVALASGGNGDEFMADGDTFRLDERLLRLGMIWQWKAQKGGAYAEDLGTFSDAINVAAGADKPSPILMDRPAAANPWWGSQNAYLR
jgi:hypothetical protein